MLSIRGGSDMAINFTGVREDVHLAQVRNQQSASSRSGLKKELPGSKRDGSIQEVCPFTGAVIVKKSLF